LASAHRAHVIERDIAAQLKQKSFLNQPRWLEAPLKQMTHIDVLAG
jgi:hypothetical protein